MKQVLRFPALTALGLFLIGQCAAQSTATKKVHTFHGKVEAVNEAEKSVLVNGEKVEGWMAAMTMDYKVADPAVFQKVKPGDQIMATVDDGDPVLHKVQVMPKQGSDSKTKK